MLLFKPNKDNEYIGLKKGNYLLDQWIAENNLTVEFQRFIKKLAGIEVNLVNSRTFFSYETKIFSGKAQK